MNTNQSEYLSMWGNLMSSSNAARDRLSKALEDAQEQIQHNYLVSHNQASSSNSNTTNVKKEEISSDDTYKKYSQMKGISETWNSMLDATKNTISTTKKVLEEEIQQLQIPSMNVSVIQEMDISMPLDATALQDTEVVYITDRIIAMKHPGVQSDTDGDLTANRKLAAVSHLLKKRHGGQFMVWNLSELEYDTSIFSDQVLSFKFPGSPSPPLGLLIKILMSLESWLKADSKNIAVIHCLTGKGRTSITIAAFLCWTGECGFLTMNDALAYIASCKRYDVNALTIPSQRRYLNYVSNMLDGVRPHRPPVILKRVIMSDAPSFENIPLTEAVDFIMKKDGPSFEPISIASETNDDLNEINSPQSLNLKGCAPYLQIFKSGKLLYTSCLSQGAGKIKSDSLPWCVASSSDQNVTKKHHLSFSFEAVVQGDILIRCRHMTSSGQRISMFRVALHTGYIVAPRVLRLTKAEIDGACMDPRIPAGFYLDFVFEPCDTKIASLFLNETNKGDSNIENSEADNEVKRKVLSLKSSYDSMIYDNGGVWESITKRQQEMLSNDDNSSSKSVGPTIGRIRDISKTKLAKYQGQNLSEVENNNNPILKPLTPSTEIFSIGGHTNINFEEEITFQNEQDNVSKRDELMEALNAIEQPSPEFKPSKNKVHENVMKNLFEEVQISSVDVDDPLVKKIENPDNGIDRLEITSEIDNEFDFDYDLDEGELNDFSDDDQSLNDLEEFLVRQT